jgi:hypothetical protein
VHGREFENPPIAGGRYDEAKTKASAAMSSPSRPRERPRIYRQVAIRQERAANAAKRDSVLDEERAEFLGFAVERQ